MGASLLAAAAWAWRSSGDPDCGSVSRKVEPFDEERFKLKLGAEVLRQLWADGEADAAAALLKRRTGREQPGLHSPAANLPLRPPLP